jgi:hypothetical protein
MYRIFILLLAVCLSACGTLGSVLTPGVSPAPLAATTIDDTNLLRAWHAYDVAIDALNLAVTSGALKPGSPKAIAIADANDKVLRAFQGAEHAAAGLSTTSYVSALALLDAALADFKVAIRSK